MKLRPGFSLLEITIAMGLAAIVMLGLAESYRVVVNYIARTRHTARLDRQVVLLFNQVEKDISTAYIPVIPPEVVPEKEAAQKIETEDEKKAREEEAKKQRAPKTDEERKKELMEKREKRKHFFMAEIDNSEFNKVNGKRAELLKFFTFICTNPLSVHGEQRARIARVRYELVKDKARSKRDQTVYTLVRKECADLMNVKMKAGEQEGPVVSSYEVAYGLKGFFIKFFTFKEPEVGKEDEEPKDGPEELSTFAWGEKKFSIGMLPQRVEVSAVFWNEKMNDTITYQATVPIIAYPLREEEMTAVPAEAKGSPLSHMAPSDAAADPGISRTSGPLRPGISHASTQPSGKKGWR